MVSGLLSQNILGFNARVLRIRRVRNGVFGLPQTFLYLSSGRFCFVLINECQKLFDGQRSRRTPDKAVYSGSVSQRRQPVVCG
jgi:hypothetical protein